MDGELISGDTKKHSSIYSQFPPARMFYGHSLLG